ncbi:uncharacterized protein ARMOST_04665 [Armillaria ostoyae]|uniref:Uncharacterized protein n=1 Tax=Armillaria ostoyae TaxID=47428 RepID=A0A284QY69_ARMOS|nr:uncharacterized protein ARMOST_04665 [Armillaria ostoyae]
MTKYLQSVDDWSGREYDN